MGFKAGLTWANLAWGFSNTFDKDDTSNKEVVLVDWEVRQSVIDEFKQQGKKVICYLSVGTKENFRQDVKANRGAWDNLVIGTLDAFNEGWLDISRLSDLQALMEPRFETCRQKGCDAVEPDNIDCFESSACFRNLNGGSTRSAAKLFQEDYCRWQIETAHAKGMMIGMKNAQNLMGEIGDLYDFAVTESCLRFKNCDMYIEGFLEKDKAVFHVEYNEDTEVLCRPNIARGPYLSSKFCDPRDDSLCDSDSFFKSCFIDPAKIDYDLFIEREGLATAWYVLIPMFFIMGAVALARADYMYRNGISPKRFFDREA